MNKKIAFITGATSGIGKATALLLSKNDFDLIITGRREKLLSDTKKEIESDSNALVMTLCFDVTDNRQVEKAIDGLNGNWVNIDLLINNAGLALGLGTIQEGNTDDWDTMIDTNIKGLLYVSRKVSQLMISRKSGQIVNIGSIAGKEVYPGGNVYCATKHAVEAITKAMRIDMLEHGIKVTSVCPGMVETEFSIVRFKGDKEKADSVYKGLQPLKGEDIAEVVLFVATRPPHVNINDILVMPSAQANSMVVDRKS